MKEYIPAFILVLVGIGFYYFQPAVMIESSEETRIDDKPLAKKNLETKEPQDKPIGVIERPEEKRIEDKPIAKKSFEIKESENKEIYGDRFPRRYLSNNWSTNEGPMKLMQGDDM